MIDMVCFVGVNFITYSDMFNFMWKTFCVLQQNIMGQFCKYTIIAGFEISWLYIYICFLEFKLREKKYIFGYYIFKIYYLSFGFIFVLGRIV